jgi:hypothetical protein
MSNKKSIIVKGTEISIFQIENSEYISLTDIARYKDAINTDDIIKNWLRNRNTIELLGFWEQLHNPDFKPVEFDGFKTFKNKRPQPKAGVRQTEDAIFGAVNCSTNI